MAGFINGGPRAIISRCSPLQNVMTELDDSRAAPLSAVIAMQEWLSEWLLDRALPLWDQHGVDRRAGGYFETLGSPGAHSEFVVTGDVRRGRVVARQIYAFDVGRRLGWQSMASSPIDHGCDFLFAHLHQGRGLFHNTIDASTREPCSTFSLYEHAFYLFALARVNATLGERYPTAATALQVLDRLRCDMGRSGGGFEESDPPSLPLKSNPHMHLLEAALAWVEAVDPPLSEPWIELARELVGVCLTRFRDNSTGAIREYFDYEWNTVAGDDGHIIEPGHQFEWSWLLMNWSRSPHSTCAERFECASAAAQLIELGESYGVDEIRGVAVNELWDDMTIKNGAAKLWPQTERLKAWCAMLDRAQTESEADRACRHITAAARAMARYLRADVPGLWHESWASDGSFTAGPSRASSFYHLVGAIDALHGSVKRLGVGSS